MGLSVPDSLLQNRQPLSLRVQIHAESREFKWEIPSGLRVANLVCGLMVYQYLRIKPIIWLGGL